MICAMLIGFPLLMLSLIRILHKKAEKEKARRRNAADARSNLTYTKKLRR